jgi:hypothetical protein
MSLGECLFILALIIGLLFVFGPPKNGPWDDFTDL